MKPENRKRSAAGLEPLTPHALDGSDVCIAHSRRPERSMGQGRNPVSGNAMVNNPGLIPHDFVDGYRLIVNSRHPVVRQTEAREPVVTEVFRGNKRVAACHDSKIKTETDRMAAVNEAEAGPEASGRRQRRPAAIVI